MSGDWQSGFQGQAGAKWPSTGVDWIGQSTCRLRRTLRHVHQPVSPTHAHARRSTHITLCRPPACASACLQAKGARLVSITSVRGSSLEAACDLAVHLPLERELCPFDLAPVTSTAIQMVFGDTVAIALMQVSRPGCPLASARMLGCAGGHVGMCSGWGLCWS